MRLPWSTRELRVDSGAGRPFTMVVGNHVSGREIETSLLQNGRILKDHTESFIYWPKGQWGVLSLTAKDYYVLNRVKATVLNLVFSEEAFPRLALYAYIFLITYMYFTVAHSLLLPTCNIIITVPKGRGGGEGLTDMIYLLRNSGLG